MHINNPAELPGPREGSLILQYEWDAQWGSKEFENSFSNLPFILNGRYFAPAAWACPDKSQIPALFCIIVFLHRILRLKTHRSPPNK
jgi:hypothetical protein